MFEARREQVFPTLEKAEMKRLCRFGERRSFATGEYLAKAGEIGPGMFVILSGEVVVRQRDDRKPHDPIVTYGRVRLAASWPSFRAGRPWSTLWPKPMWKPGHSSHRISDLLVEEPNW